MGFKFDYKGDIYTFRKLEECIINFPKLYSEGIVTEVDSGDNFNIKDISSKRDKYTEAYIDIVTTIDGYSNALNSRLRAASKKKELDLLEGKYLNKSITIEELTRLIVCKYNSKTLKETYSYTSYCFINTNVPLPNLSECELGKFYKLCHSFLTHKANTLLDTKNINSNPLTIKMLCDKLNLKESQTYDFMKKLNKLGIIKYHIIDEKKHIMVNPIYALNGKITPTIYSAFKKDIDSYFPLIPNELKDLWLMSSLDNVTPFVG